MNKHSSTVGELLNRASEMSDAEKLQFWAFLHHWTGDKAKRLQEGMSGEFLEIIVNQEEPIEVLPEEPIKEQLKE